LFTAATEVRGAVDADVRGALNALIQTYKTLESGIYYETRPDSAFAREIMDSVRRQVQQFQEAEAQQAGFSRSRDRDVLQLLVFLYRIALDRDNGRSRGKAFLDFLRMHFEPATASQDTRLIIPGV
jgi:hypothetical protein